MSLNRTDLMDYLEQDPKERTKTFSLATLTYRELEHKPDISELTAEIRAELLQILDGKAKNSN